MGLQQRIARLERLLATQFGRSSGCCCQLPKTQVIDTDVHPDAGAVSPIRCERCGGQALRIIVRYVALKRPADMDSKV